MAVCCQNLPLGALSNLSAPSVLVGELFKKFILFLNTGVYQVSSFSELPNSKKVSEFLVSPDLLQQAYR